MNKSLGLVSIILFFSVCAKAQWLSIEASMGPGSSKSILETEEISGESIFGTTDGMDTFYIRNQYSYKTVNQKRASQLFSLFGSLRINLPVSPRVTLSTGLGLSATLFEYRDVDEISDYSNVRDTLFDFNPATSVPVFKNNGAGGTPLVKTEDGIICDTLINLPSSEQRPFRNNFTGVITTRNGLFNFVLPLEFTYNIIPDLISLRVGTHFNLSFAKRQSYYDLLREKNHYRSTDSLTVCTDYGSTVSNDDTEVLTNMSVTAIARLDAIVTDRSSVFVSFSSTLNSLTNPGADTSKGNFSIAYEYRPTIIRIGISIDLISKKNYNKRKTNYLIKARMNDK